jgi:hypothetical protein
MTTKRAWHQLHVEETDNLRFRVESESGHGTYFVDILENQGKGRCSCPDFECRIAPIYSGKKQAPANTPTFIAACKHQLRVKLFIADKFIAEMLKQKGYRHHDGP